MLELLLTVKPQPQGILHSKLSTYATRTYALSTIDAAHYRIPMQDLAAVTVILQRAFEKGLVNEVYIRNQAEVRLSLPDDAYNPLEEHVIWQEEESEGEGTRMHTLGWRVSPPTYTLSDLLKHVNA